MALAVARCALFAMLREDKWKTNGVRFISEDQTWPNSLSFALRSRNISLVDQLKAFVGEQVGPCGDGISGEHVLDLIRKNQDRQTLRSLLLAGAASEPVAPMGEAYFDTLRDQVHAGIQRSNKSPHRKP